MAMFGRKKYDNYRLPKGTNLTPSKDNPNAFRGMTHGKKGVESLPEFEKVDEKRSFLNALLAFAGKGALLLVAIGAALALIAVLINSIAAGISAGIASITDAIAAASSYLVIGASIAAAVAVLVFVSKPIKELINQRAHKQQLLEARTQQAVALATVAAQSTAITQGIRADWYPDPSHPSQIRYWDGNVWTNHVRQSIATSAVPAGWYPAPSDPSQLQYWDGSMWTSHRASQGTASSELAESQQNPTDTSRISMTTAEWQKTVRAWMAAGAAEQELWRRLTEAQIIDGDQATLEAQRRMEQLTAAQGSEQIRLMIESNPQLRDELGVAEFLASLMASLSAIEKSSQTSDNRTREKKLFRIRRELK